MFPSDPFFAEETAFDAHAAAEAQLWNNNDEPDLIVTVPGVGYVFTSANVDVDGEAADSAGVFSYNSLADIPTDGPTNFKVTTRQSGGRTYVIVTFYADNGDVYGRFVGTDPALVAMAAGLVDTTGVGNWAQ